MAGAGLGFTVLESIDQPATDRGSIDPAAIVPVSTARVAVGQEPIAQAETDRERTAPAETDREPIVPEATGLRATAPEGIGRDRQEAIPCRYKPSPSRTRAPNSVHPGRCRLSYPSSLPRDCLTTGEENRRQSSRPGERDMFSCSTEALETPSAGGSLCHRPESQYLTRRMNAHVSRRGFMAGLATSAANLELQATAAAQPQTPTAAGSILFTNVRLFDGDLLLVDGDPLADIALIADPQKNFRIIMKDGKIYKNTL
jgi:hypothetical protein